MLLVLLELLLELVELVALEVLDELTELVLLLLTLEELVLLAALLEEAESLDPPPQPARNSVGITAKEISRAVLPTDCCRECRVSSIMMPPRVTWAAFNDSATKQQMNRCGLSYEISQCGSLGLGIRRIIR
ncbi:MAG: hypothetical protein QM808_13965 [Steroidobacteraceae bacterium]